MAPSTSSVQRTIEAIWRIESAKLIAALTRLVRDVGLAEDLAQDALVAALGKWPSDGLPDNPGAWLMTVAKRRAIDRIRRDIANRRPQIGPFPLLLPHKRLITHCFPLYENQTAFEIMADGRHGYTKGIIDP